MIKRIIAGLLAAYMLLLLALPCHDNCKEKSCANTVEQSNNAPQNETDICSPFCFCACCATSAIVHPQSDCSVLNFTVNTIFFDSRPNFISEYIYSIWQPPKIC